MRSLSSPFISIHALRGEGDPRRHFDRHAAVDGISIHALRGEGDDNNIVLHGVITISIHALRGEGDNQKHALTMMFDEFQSTPSVGRATLAQSLAVVAYAEFQSTPSVGRATVWLRPAAR